MGRWLVALTTLVLLAGPALSSAASAADQSVHYRRAHHHAKYARDCGCCGCWRPEYVWSRQLYYTYPSDPRYTLTSEPRYVRGRVRPFLHNLF